MNQADTLEKLMKEPKTTIASSLSQERHHPRVISVSSGKGGVGKTNLTSNVAYNLALAGQRVLVLDADLNLANVDVLLGLTPKYNLHHVFQGERTLGEVVIQGPAGIKILPGSSGIMELASLTESQKLYFLEEMEEMANDIDILLIDTAAGINDNVIYFNLASQERVILLTPEPTSLTDAYALIKVLSKQHAVRRFKIVVNQVSSRKEAIGVFKKLSVVCDQFLDSISMDFLGMVPSDTNLTKAVRGQRLVSELFPEAESSKMFAHIGEQLLLEAPEPEGDGNIKFFWQRLFDK